MIFVTVGVQLPFDRLIRAMDDWAGRHGRDDVVAQVGESAYVPHTIDVRPRLAADEFRAYVERAELVVAHAGMGSILTALELGKPIIVMPRRAALGEHRNDHQLATSRRMASHAAITVAQDGDDLVRMLDASDIPVVPQRIASHADDGLINELTSFIAQPPAQPRFVGRFLRRPRLGFSFGEQ
ncbi:glycosyltransferase [Salinarimonas soli]|nr:glycosyltransferase [Salinarimonas soli]